MSKADDVLQALMGPGTFLAQHLPVAYPETLGGSITMTKTRGGLMMGGSWPDSIELQQSALDGNGDFVQIDGRFITFTFVNASATYRAVSVTPVTRHIVAERV